MNSWTKVYAAAFLAAVALGGATARVASAADAPAATEIVIKDFMFEPMTISVKAGTVVAWSNKDDEPHTVASDSGLFRSSALDTNERFTFKFDKPGTYHYVCSIHPKMIGTIVVQ